MTDYAAAPVQPLVQGFFVGTTVTGTLPFIGKGVAFNGQSLIQRTALGLYRLTFDPGLPGLSGEAPSQTTPASAESMRTLVNLRGIAGTGLTTIAHVSVSYLDGGTDGGLQQMEIAFSNQAGTAIDPTGTDASGVEVIVFRAFTG